jgi:hypothetical protein
VNPIVEIFRHGNHFEGLDVVPGADDAMVDVDEKEDGGKSKRTSGRRTSSITKSRPPPIKKVRFHGP